MRKRIYEVIEVAKENDKVSHIYDLGMIVVIIMSLVPLLFKTETTLLYIMDKVTVCIFIVDYILRWITADYKYAKKKLSSFLRYPFSFMAIVDLLSILPSVMVINKSIKAVRILRLLRAMRVLRVFKSIRYSKTFEIIGRVLTKSKDQLIAVGMLAFGYILVSALVIYNVEPNSFKTFFDALYWATVSLMTVGYGDIYPVTVIGRSITMISSFLGVAVVALPAGIITAGYVKELDDRGDKNEKYEMRKEEE